MNKHLRNLFLVLAIIISTGKVGMAQNNCQIQNKVFSDNESVTFFVFYTLAGVWVNAGTVNFTVNKSTYENKPVYHVVGTGTTNPSYDWIFKVRDRYESIMDYNTLLPYKFIRNVDEGGYKKNEIVYFDRKNNTAKSPKGTYNVTPCIQDVLSEVYFARNIDFDKYKPNDLIPFDLFLDDEIHKMHVRYLGKETIKTRYGKFKTIKFKPMLLKGSLFEGGEKMTVWVTDDGNKLPVRIESPILVGNVKVDMMMYKNTKYPLTSLIKI